MSQFHHLSDLFIRQAHDTLGLGDAVQVQAIAVHRFEQCPHDLRTLDPGNFKPVLTAIFESLLRGRQVIGIATGKTNGLQKLSCFFHAVHFYLFLSATLWHIILASLHQPDRVLLDRGLPVQIIDQGVDSFSVIKDDRWKLTCQSFMDTAVNEGGLIC